jgi:hypothetical protein
MRLPKLIILFLLSSCMAQVRVNGGAVVNGGVRFGAALGTGGGGGGGTLEDNTYCNSSNVWTGGVSDGPALLLVRCYNTALTNTPTPLGQLQATITSASLPDPATALTNELTAATCGEIIYIAAGTLVSGNIPFPSHGCDDAHYIQVRTNASDANLPAPGVRITPCYAGLSSLVGYPSWPSHAGCATNYMAIIEVPNSMIGSTNSAVTFANNADHYRVGPGIWLRRQAGGIGYSVKTMTRVSTNVTVVLNDVIVGGDINVGDTDHIQSPNDSSFQGNYSITSVTPPSTLTITQLGKPDATVSGGSLSALKLKESIIVVPTANQGVVHVIFDRILCSGTPDTETGKCLATGASKGIALIDSFLYEFHCFLIFGSCVDSQGWNGGGAGLADGTAGNWKFVNNFIVAAAECWIFGGGGATAIPVDIELRRNWCFKPNTWNKNDAANYNGGGPPPSGGQGYNIKNMGESKTGDKLLMEANVHAFSYKTSDQSAAALLLTPKNQGGNCPICSITNVTMRYIRTAHSAEGMQVINANATGGGPATGGHHYSIHDVVFDDLGYSLSGSSIQNLWEFGGLPVPFQLHDVTINHITMGGTSGTSSSIALSGPPQKWSASQIKAVGDYVMPTVPTNPPTVFKVAVGGTEGTIEPVWPARLSGGTVTDGGVGGVTWQEDSANLTLYLAYNIVIKNSIFPINPSRDVFSTGGGTTNCANNYVLPASPLTKFNACWTNYTLTNNVLIGDSGATWPGVNFFPVDGNGVGFVGYNSGNGGDYRLCTAAGVPDVACLVGSPYAANGANPADDSKDMGADIPTISSKTAGVDSFQ